MESAQNRSIRLEVASSNKQTILASIVLTLCLVSDSLLYLLLPLYFEDFGLVFIWVGILLSVNRLVRILLQFWLIHWYQKLGLKNTLLVAVLFAAAGCSFFTIDSPVYVLLLGRILWGVAYALLRMSCLFLATEDSQTSLGKLGWYTALQEVGPLLILILAPVFIEQLNPQSIMFIPLALCFIALVPIFMLQQVQSTTERLNSPSTQSQQRSFRLPEWNKDHALTLIFSTLYEGIWVVCLAQLFIVSGSSQIQALNYVALLLVARRAFNLILGITFVRVKRSHNSRYLVKISSLLMIIASFLIYYDYLIFGSLLAIFGRGFYMLLMPKVLSDEAKSSSAKKSTINAFTIWRDIASALGAFLGGVLLHYGLVKLFFVFMVCVAGLLLIRHKPEE